MKKGLIMKKMYKNILVIVVMVLMGVLQIDARVRTIQTEREFDQQLNKSNFLVALFYEGPHKRAGKFQQEKMRPFFQMYETVSGRKLYDDADVVFTKININNQAMGELMRRYAVTTNPAFVIFIKQQPVIASNGKIAQLIGFVSEHELQEFINAYCMNGIQQKVQAKEQNRKERVIKAQEESDPYFYPAVYYAPEYDFSWQKPLKYDAQGNEKQ
ncbi:MAG TPA: thioredoxin family protein [Puia sp.]|jgi:thioredoxin-related protein|nr:thioredoxin family protein [Puia sp.]